MLKKLKSSLQKAMQSKSEQGELSFSKTGVEDGLISSYAEEDKSLSDGQDLLGYRSTVSQRSSVVVQKADPLAPPVPNKQIKTPKPSPSPSSYSSGFEKIYSLEEVDPRTIQKLQDPLEEQEEFFYELQREEEGKESLELELNFGELAEGSMESLQLSEPIQVLGLSQSAEKKLLEQNKKILKDLLDLSQQRYALGQGHVDEIADNLKKYLKGTALYSSQTVDFKSLLQALFGDLPPQFSNLLLAPYGLEKLFPLKESERASLLHTKSDEKKRLKQEALQAVRAIEKERSFLQQWEKIMKAFVLPWARKRQALVSQKELLERLLSISKQEQIAFKTLRFIRATFFKEEAWMSPLLPSIERGVYCLDIEAQSLYQMVITKAKTYFYRKGLSYALGQLAELLYREFAKNWKCLPEGFIERALLLSPSFTVFREGDKKSVRMQ